MARIRPTMEHVRKAEEYDWLEAHPDAVMHVGGGEWAIFDSDAPDAREVGIGPLREAIQKARRLRDSVTKNDE